jgi:hypothetical protein
MRDVILHAFNWQMSEIAAEAAKIASCGFGAVLFPPPALAGRVLISRAPLIRSVLSHKLHFNKSARASDPNWTDN